MAQPSNQLWFRVAELKIDQYGRVSISESEAVDALYQQKITDFQNVYFEDPSVVECFNQARYINADRIADLTTLTGILNSVDVFDKNNQQQWLMPTGYCPNLVEILYGMCESELQTNRVSEELELFIQHNMMDLLYYLKYLVDTLRANNIVWGLGRGSSVASYVLYLIGVHKIDSIKYELDIREFLK
jgi:DNA polymerase III alpha subunit